MFSLNAVERKTLGRRERIKSIKAVPKRINTPVVARKQASEFAGRRAQIQVGAKMDYRVKFPPRFTGARVGPASFIIKRPSQDIYFY